MSAVTGSTTLAELGAILRAGGHVRMDILWKHATGWTVQLQYGSADGGTLPRAAAAAFAAHAAAAEVSR